MKSILIINGSAGEGSANQKLLRHLAGRAAGFFDCTFSQPLKALPPFDPALTLENPPEKVSSFRERIAAADGVMICTPEYVFSIPSGLKNLIEWCVATTVFTGKPVGLITASASGHKGHEELQLLMRTLGARFTADTTLLVSGIKAWIDADGTPKEKAGREALGFFLEAFRALVDTPPATGQSSSP